MWCESTDAVGTDKRKLRILTSSVFLESASGQLRLSNNNTGWVVEMPHLSYNTQSFSDKLVIHNREALVDVCR